MHDVPFLHASLSGFSETLWLFTLSIFTVVLSSFVSCGARVAHFYDCAQKLNHGVAFVADAAHRECLANKEKCSGGNLKSP
jgi:hypothetical protein